MREIEFRAWDGKVMRNDFYLSLDGDVGQFDIHEGIFLGNMHTIKLMQYVGLRDKNRKKIFEGDILEGKDGRKKVIWAEGEACFDWESEDGEFPDEFASFAMDYEIIGNIYENPELFKEGL